VLNQTLQSLTFSKAKIWGNLERGVFFIMTHNYFVLTTSNLKCKFSFLVFSDDRKKYFWHPNLSIKIELLDLS
jgi:hypothetical protein